MWREEMIEAAAVRRGAAVPIGSLPLWKYFPDRAGGNPGANGWFL